MEQSNVDVAPAEASLPTTEHEAAASSLAPPSTSASAQPDAPMSDAVGPAPATTSVEHGNQPSDTYTEPQFSAQTESIVKRINQNAANAAATGTPGWEAAKEQIMKDMATSDKIATPTPPRDAAMPKRGGRGGKRASFADGDSITVKMEGASAQTTPASTGRGRGGGRPRGRGRGGGRGGKRKREGHSDEDSDDSEVYSPVVTTTKSGRSIQKPTSFVPPPASPTNPNKRKRPYRRNPESAVCKVCLRGTSPASNMIVFCDGCNTPYHRYCHHPPIDQAVVDEVDKEWYCKQCEKERVEPVSESQIVDFIAAPGASAEQRQRYFASLPPGMLVTLLTKATTLKPDLPVFAPNFQARAANASGPVTGAAPAPGSISAPPAPFVPPLPTNGDAYAHPPTYAISGPQSFTATSMSAPPNHPGSHPQATAGASSAHASYQASYGQPPPSDFVPEGHPPNYPRPGYGLMRTLPPEQEDMQWLVEDDDRYGVFTHMYQVDPKAANVGLNGGTELT